MKKTHFSTSTCGLTISSFHVFSAHGELPERAWFGFTEDKNHQANANRISFWVETREGVDKIGALLDRED